MKILFDTSVLVAGIIESHSEHGRALPYLQRVKNGEDEGVVSAHSLTEVYSILTRLPLQPRLSAENAQRLITENIVSHFHIVALAEHDYIDLIEHLAKAGTIGGTVYDGIILFVATKVEVDQILTLNERDFRRVLPSVASKVVVP